MAFLDETGLAELWACANEKYLPLIEANAKNANSRTKISAGSYTGTGNNKIFHLNFEPKFLIVRNEISANVCTWMKDGKLSGLAGNTAMHADCTKIDDGDGTFRLSITANANIGTTSGMVFRYAIIG